MSLNTVDCIVRTLLWTRYCFVGVCRMTFPSYNQNSEDLVGTGSLSALISVGSSVIFLFLLREDSPYDKSIRPVGVRQSLEVDGVDKGETAWHENRGSIT